MMLQRAGRFHTALPTAPNDEASTELIKTAARQLICTKPYVLSVNLVSGVKKQE